MAFLQATFRQKKEAFRFEYNPIQHATSLESLNKVHLDS